MGQVAEGYRQVIVELCDLKEASPLSWVLRRIFCPVLLRENPGAVT